MENESILTNAEDQVVADQVAENSGAEGTEPVEAEPAPKPEVKQQEPAAPARQTREDNAVAAATRRAVEAQHRAEAEANKKTLERLASAFKELGYNGQSPEEIADQVEATKRNISVDEVRRLREVEKTTQEAALKEALKNDPEYIAAMQAKERLEAIDRQRTFDDDLAAIKKAYPDTNIKNVEQLGPTFFNARTLGLGAVEAYDIVQKEQARNTPAKPPEVGAANSSAGAEKDFYSQDEVDKLSPEQLDDPNILEKVMKSMTKWKKG